MYSNANFWLNIYAKSLASRICASSALIESSQNMQAECSSLNNARHSLAKHMFLEMRKATHSKMQVNSAAISERHLKVIIHMRYILKRRIPSILLVKIFAAWIGRVWFARWWHFSASTPGHTFISSRSHLQRYVLLGTSVAPNFCASRWLEYCILYCKQSLLVYIISIVIIINIVLSSLLLPLLKQCF